MRAGVAVIALMLAACSASNKSTMSAEDTMADGGEGDANAKGGSDEPSKSYTAVLSCRVQNSPMPIGICFGGQSGGGSLKVKSGGSVRQYTSTELSMESNQNYELPLTAPFQVTAQANADDSNVLRLEIKSGGKVVHQDETSQFGVIDVSDDDLS